MTSRLIIMLAGTALTVGACSKQNANNDMTANNVSATDNGMAAGNGSTAANVGAPAAEPLNAQSFANAAAASDRFEIESSKLAATQASSAAIKKFAATMISAHTASTAKLKGITAGMSPAMTPDDTLSADQTVTLASLKDDKGAAFDSAYAAAQVNAHQQTLDAVKGYAATGDDDQLKSFANGLIPVVTAHLNMAKGLK